MFLYAVKVLVSVIVIIAVAEISKRNSIAGAVLASLPLVSMGLALKSLPIVAYIAGHAYDAVDPHPAWYVVLPHDPSNP
jgi:hypothetical protein